MAPRWFSSHSTTTAGECRSGSRRLGLARAMAWLLFLLEAWKTRPCHGHPAHPHPGRPPPHVASGYIAPLQLRTRPLGKPIVQLSRNRPRTSDPPELEHRARLFKRPVEQVEE